MIIGFSGSRRGMNQYQKEVVRKFLSDPVLIVEGEENEFHHGDCKGSDNDAFTIAKELGWKTIAHPSLLDNWRAYTESDIILPPHPPLIRNYHIVDAVDTSIATPDTNFEVLRSGTWAFIRYARQKNKITENQIFYPRGYNV